MFASLLAAGLLSGPNVYAQDWEPGEQIDEALALQITRDGFASASELAAVLIPSAIDMPPVEEKGVWAGITWYELSFKDAWVGIEITDARLTPGNGLLDLDIDLEVQINSDADRFSLVAKAIGLGPSCTGWVDPFPVNALTSIALQIQTDDDGNKTIDAVLGAIQIDQDLDGQDITLDDCLIGELDQVLNYIGVSIFDLVLGPLDGLLQDAISDAVPDLETTIEEAFAAASIQQDLAIGETDLSLSLEPNELAISPDGLELLLGGSAVSEPADCIRYFDPESSRKTATAAPSLGSAQGDLSLLLSDDFANQVLYGLWRGGVLCYSLDDSASLPLNTAILGLLAGDAFDSFFPDPQPVIIATRPSLPPVVAYDGIHDVAADITQLGLDIFAELDGRWVRLIGLDLDTTIGFDLDFDTTSGVLGVELFFDPSAVDARVGFNELAPEANEVVIEKFSTVFGNLIEPLVGGLLGDNLTFNLGSIEGVGLSSLQATPAGQGDWLELAAGIGPVPYAGCEQGCGGGDASGCGGGMDDSGGDPLACTTVLHRHHKSIWLLPLGLVLFLRRRD